MNDLASPIEDEALELEAGRVSELLRRVRKRAPREVQARVREALEAVFQVVSGAEGEVSRDARVALVRRLEGVTELLTARTIFSPQFYDGGRLAMIRRMEPVRIRGTVDQDRLAQHVDRYEQRVRRAQERLDWFLERSGVAAPPSTGPKPWEEPYVAIQEDTELLWKKGRGG